MPGYLLPSQAWDQQAAVGQQANEAFTKGILGQLQIAGALQKQQQEQQLRGVLAESGGDPEKAMEALIKSGNIAGAHALAPVLIARQKSADAQSKGILAAQQRQAQGALAGLLSTGGYQGAIAGPSNVAMNDQEALRQVQEADAQGRQLGVNVPNPGTVQGLSVLSDPGKAIPQILKQQIPQKAPNPLADTKAVAGGYIVPGPNGPTFTRTARDPSEGPMSDIGRLNEDLKAGRITQDQFNQAMSRKGSLPGITPENAHLNGDAFLATLEPTMANNVKALIKYEAPLTTFSSRQGERAALLAAARQADPNFNAMKYPVRQQVMADFTKGPTANNIVALDQGINHMGTLYDLGQALENKDLKAVNSIINIVKDQTGRPEVNNFNTAKQAVGEELMRVFRQVNASEVEAAQWQKKFSEASSPAQLKGAIQTATTLLEGRVNAINNRWNRAFDTDKGYPNLFSPEAIDVFKRVGLTMKVPQLSGATTAAPASGSGQWSVVR